MSYYGNPEDYGPDDTGELPGTTTDLFNRLTAERALADDLAAVLAMGADTGFANLIEVERVLARYGEARGR